MGIEVEIKLRPEQNRLNKERKRFAVRVAHRRFGKTWLAISELFAEALTAKHKAWRGFFIAPTYKQAKRASWDYLKEFAHNIPGASINEAELRADFPNGARVTLLGAEAYDTLRGQYAHAVILDECQLIPSAALTSVILPMLSDHKGWLIAQGTASGRHNLLFELYDMAKDGEDPNWSAHLVPVSATDIISAEELEQQRRLMSDAEYEQEYNCSFNAAIRGAYLSKEMAAADTEGRVSSVRHDSASDITIAMDLGWSDLMVATVVQAVGSEHHFIDCLAYSETKISDVVNSWRDLPYRIDTLILPHDAKQHELVSGTTRENMFRKMLPDTNVIVAGRVRDKHEGIEQVRQLLPHAWFDRDATRTLVEALNAYRAEYDEVKRVAKMSPVHDWSSHYFDAVQTYALGRPRRGMWGEMPSSVLAAGTSRRSDRYGYTRGAA